jgi:alpha-mannosidase
MKIFLSLTIALAASATCSAIVPLPAQTPDRTLYVVGTAHLDTQWRWTIQKTVTDYIPATLRMNLAYFDEYPDYIFSFEGSIRYILAKEYYPDLYAKMKERIKEGRWRIAGSWIDAVDVNMPSPEALIRQNLYGNGFFKKEFGKTSVDVYLPDCFGFGYALPSIAAHCGLKGFTTQKLLPYGSAYGGVPFNIGTWEGVDGSSLVSVLEPGRYRHDVGTDWYKADWLLKRIDDLGRKSGLYVDLQLHGMGDRGDGPTKRSMDNLAACIRAGGPIKVINKGSDDLFRELKPDQIAKLPHYNGELLMSTHGTGCYTTQAALKKWNRKNELLADAAERAATMAALLGVDYPQAKLNEAWTRFLWHGFHDDLTGTSIPEAYAFTWNDQILSLNQFGQIVTDSIGVVAASLDTQTQGIPVVVYNPLAFDRADPIVAELTFPQDAPEYVRVFDAGGKEIPAQVLSREGRSAKIAFVAGCAGTEAAVYDVRSSSKPSPLAGRLKATGRTLENGRYKVVVNDSGDIASVFDKQSQKELLKAPVRLALSKDKPVRYAAWEMTYEDVTAAPREYVGGAAEIKVVENGPAQVALQITRKVAGTKLVQTVRLAACGSRVEVDSEVDWRTLGTMMKAEFPLATGNPNATYDIGLGTIERGNNRKALYEVPAQQWADLTQPDGSYGVSILSESKHGWDKPDDETLRLTLLRTPEVKDTDYQFNNDVGHHHFSYAVYGHSGDWRNGSSREGERFNQPIRAFQVDRHPGKLGRVFRLIASGSPQVSIKALKRAEQGKEWIVRVFETSGRPAKQAKLRFGTNVLSVRELDGFEAGLPAPTLPMAAQGSEIAFDMKPYRPRTFAVRLAPVNAGLPRVAAKVVRLPYNVDVVSTRGEEGTRPAIPAELWPKSVLCGEVDLKLGPAGAMNAVECRGQTISLPKGSRVVLLAHSTGGDVEVPFRFGDVSRNVTVPDQSAFIGQWDSRLVAGQLEKDPERFAKAYIKRTSVAWVGTHRHDAAGSDEPYVFCYLFRLELDVPDGTKTLTLPNDPRIRVFAATAMQSPRPSVTPAGVLYD